MSTKGIAARLRGNKPSSSTQFKSAQSTQSDSVPVTPASESHAIQFPTVSGTALAPVPVQTRGAWTNGIETIRKAASLPTPPPPVKRKAPVANTAAVVEDDLAMSESDYDDLW